jgi:hypothetical protein
VKVSAEPLANDAPADRLGANGELQREPDHPRVIIHVEAILDGGFSDHTSGTWALEGW